MRDPKLIELAAKAHHDHHEASIPEFGWRKWEKLTDWERSQHIKQMSAVIDAINASGIAWVAPWEPSNVMFEGSKTARRLGEWDAVYQDMRDAYLAEQKRDR